MIAGRQFRREAMPRRSALRQATMTSLMVLASGLIVSPARAGRVAVPIPLQAQLLAKSAAYDRALAERGGDRVRVLIVVDEGSAESIQTAIEMRHELAAIGHIAERPVELGMLAYPGPAALARTIRERRVAILYLTPGLDAEMEKVADALSGSKVLSAAAVASYVQARAVLGFDLVSSKPKLLIHVTQARRQGVNFDPRLLKLAKVYE